LLIDDALAKREASLSERESIEAEMGKDDADIKSIEGQIEALEATYEREQWKILAYRKEDVLDFLASIREM
jgi:hypothetical protein